MPRIVRLLVGGAYVGYTVGLLALHALVAVHDPSTAPVSASVAGLALVAPLVPLKRYGFLPS